VHILADFSEVVSVFFGYFQSLFEPLNPCYLFPAGVAVVSFVVLLLVVVRF
jgi:hypothetical protein